MNCWSRTDHGTTATPEALEPKAETTSAGRLQQAQDRLNELQRERDRMAAQSRELAERVAEISGESDHAKLRLATGLGDEEKCREKLNALDLERARLQQKLDGCALAIKELEGRISILSETARELAQAADQERQQEVVENFQDVAYRLSRRVIATWRQACAEAFELSMLVDQTTAMARSGGLDHDHASAVLAANEKLSSYFQTESLRLVNENWPRHESHLFRRLQIRAARPEE